MVVGSAGTDAKALFCQRIGEHLRVQDIVGVALLSGGLVTLAIPLSSVAARAGGRHGLATLFAVLTGVTIAAYIIADGFGVRAAGPDMVHRVSYIAWLCVLEGPWLLVFYVGAVLGLSVVVFRGFERPMRRWLRGVVTDGLR